MYQFFSHKDVFKYSSFPDTVVDWNELPEELLNKLPRHVYFLRTVTFHQRDELENSASVWPTLTKSTINLRHCFNVVFLNGTQVLFFYIFRIASGGPV